MTWAQRWRMARWRRSQPIGFARVEFYGRVDTTIDYIAVVGDEVAIRYALEGVFREERLPFVRWPVVVTFTSGGVLCG